MRAIMWIEETAPNNDNDYLSVSASYSRADVRLVRWREAEIVFLI